MVVFPECCLLPLIKGRPPMSNKNVIILGLVPEPVEGIGVQYPRFGALFDFSDSDGHFFLPLLGIRGTR